MFDHADQSKICASYTADAPYVPILSLKVAKSRGCVYTKVRPYTPANTVIYLYSSTYFVSLVSF